MVALILSVQAYPASKKAPRLNAEYFPTSSRSEKAQRHFLQNMVTFHSYWYEDALDEFREATKIETDLIHDGLLERGHGAQLSNLRRAAGD
jgi:hypothetical protein